MGCAASTAVPEPHVSSKPRKGLQGCVKELEEVEVPELGIEFVDAILQKGSGIFNTLAEMNCTISDRVDAIKKCAGVDPDTTNIKDAIQKIIQGLPSDVRGRLKEVEPKVCVDGLLEGKLEFELHVPEDLLESATGLVEIVQLGIDMVTAAEEKLPLVVSESSELAEKLEELQILASNTDELQQQLTQSGILTGNMLEDGPAVMRAVASLTKGIAACGQAPGALLIVISNFKICCEAIVLGFSTTSSN
jgi:hypothetical protein